jgi:Family of unknown function (DUF6582)
MECRRIGTGLRQGRSSIDEIEYSEIKSMQTTWKPHEKHGELTERSDLPDSVFAFPKQRREPMTDASHVRNAIARFALSIFSHSSNRVMDSPGARALFLDFWPAWVAHPTFPFIAESE